MKTKVCKEFKFCAAHFLPNYDGPCSNIHGHTWKVRVCVSGPVEAHTGMVMDFGNLKKMVEPILNKWDHDIINKTVVNPTAEILIAVLWSSLTGKLTPKCELSSIRIWESDTSFAELSK